MARLIWSDAVTQSRRMSLIEAWAGTAIGFVVSVVLGFAVYPLFGCSFTLSQNISLTLIFTVASVLRGYAVRRLFNKFGSKP